MQQEDATAMLIDWLRNPDHGQYSRYGYGIYIPSLLRRHLEQQGFHHMELDEKVRELMPAFYAAGWDLCRRGILRPGVREYGAQATDEGNAGSGYTITPFGKEWISESDKDSNVPTEPGRFANMLSKYNKRFGDGFHERSQEAVRCYGAHAYLACCAMSGAAAESVMLATAIAKNNDEDAILKQYMAASGRRKIENIVIGKARNQLQNEYRGYSSLLKYWRDSAAHGQASSVGDNEAYTAIALLLRFAMFVDDNWDEITNS